MDKLFMGHKLSCSARIRKLRERVVNIKRELSCEHGRLMTEAYEEYKSEPIYIRRARAFEKILNNKKIWIEDGELIVGGYGHKPLGYQVEPSLVVDWLGEEIFHGNPCYPWERPAKSERFWISEEEKKSLKELISYWKGKTHSDRVLSTLSKEAKMAQETSAANAEIWRFIGDGHFIPDTQKVLHKGYKGIIVEVKNMLDSLDLGNPEDIRKRPVLQAMIISLEASINFSQRYAVLAKKLAKTTKNPQRKKELEKIATICSQVPAHPARTFYEALQAIWMTHLLILIEDQSASISFGRLDQTLYPFYQKDISEGRITKSEVLELIECFNIKTNETKLPIPWEAVQHTVGGGRAVHLTLGGQDNMGRDATNDLSYLFLETEAVVRLPYDYLGVRYHDNTPDKFLLAVIDVICSGGGKPAIFSDEAFIPALLNRGISYNDAINYAIVGCNEPAIEGKQGYHNTSIFYSSLLKVLEITLNEGRDPKTGYQLLPAEDFLNFKSYDELLKSFKKQLSYYIKLGVIQESVTALSLAELIPKAFSSSLVSDCIKRGKTLGEGGAIYDLRGVTDIGHANVGDSLAAIKKLIYEDKAITGVQLKHALETNFEDNTTTPTGEEIRKMCLSAPKFGNDDDYVDSIVREIMEFSVSEVTKYKTIRAGRGPIVSTLHNSTSTVSANVAYGKFIGATPDGREAGEPTSDGISPYMGRDVNGPTSTIKSVTKLPNMLFSAGHILNQKFSATALNSKESRKKFASLIRTYAGDLKGMQVQINIVDGATLRDAKEHPEKYPDLLIRVAGYTAFFTQITPDLQDALIARTEQPI